MVGRAARTLRGVGAGLFGQPTDAQASLLVAVVVPLEDAAEAAVRRLQLGALRDLVAPLELSAVPHVTLKLGFPVRELAPAARVVARLADDAPDLELRTGAVDAFQDGTLYLDVEPDPRLEAFRIDVVGRISRTLGVVPYPLETDGTFHAHVTLARGLHPGQVAAARRALGDEVAPLVSPVRALAMLVLWRGAWVSYARFPVRGRPPEGAP